MAQNSIVSISEEKWEIRNFTFGDETHVTTRNPHRFINAFQFGGIRRGFCKKIDLSKKPKPVAELEEGEVQPPNKTQ
ncbi:unnamed protein product [Sphenostylis stenocarpa]|uniref:Uncharacterized protein n=1 Tax=Sphenostylis stenocarpa TaxID=92480 RepID=A0AA86RP64_9FABA|nr:unnamed protein product [Sphenostylis stenocarpa]